MKNFTFVLLLVTVLFSACKKDKLDVDQEKVFVQANIQTATTPGLAGGWAVRLRPDGTADVIPGGDIVYSGKYDVKGASLKIQAERTKYEFDILSDTEIKEKKYGTLLKLKEN